MTPVQADWLTLLFAPMGVILLVIAFAATRSAAKSKAPLPVWCKVTQGGGMRLRGPRWCRPVACR